ncbi:MULTISPECIES: sensor histidine kinase [unclassified Caballeronia]|uniref:sensor histidine kinase n=1 Tax=unclassified Caballeronia TaxID=2646786 RepID=UPI002029AB56|nr:MULTISPECIES: ATP-binding protein [unclassified Caballeronia]
MHTPLDPTDSRNQSNEPAGIVRSDARIAWTLAGVLALAVFLIDALTPLDIAIAVFYVVVVLLVASSGGRKATVRAAWGCVILTLAGFVLSHDDSVSTGAIARCAVSLLAIATTSWLALRNQTATANLREQVEERKQAERALARTEAFLVDAQRLSRTASIATRLPEGTMWWSDEAYRIFDYTRDVTPSIDAILARTHPDDLALVRGAYEAEQGGAPVIDVQHRLTMPDGGIKHVHYVAHVVQRTGELEYVGALMDITETKLAQEALARSTAELAHVTRVSMLGELAASIAHETTQPIAAIVTCGDASLRWLNRPQPDLAEAKQSIAQMIRDAKRASDVIRRIRAMAKKHEGSAAVLALNETVEEALELVRSELERHGVAVGVQLAQPSPVVCCDRVQLQQVLINVIMNGAQAMAGQQAARRLSITTRMFDEHHAQVIVEDSGPGISNESAGRIFDAFFTTKHDGMGMGLSICRSIVEAHAGRIWAEKGAEGGASLQFILPVDRGTCHEQQAG